MSHKRTPFLLALLIVAGVFIATGCASKGYDRGEMTSIDKKVEGVEQAVEENQKRIKEHDERLATIGETIAAQDSKLKAVDGRIDEVRKSVKGTLIMKETIRSGDAKFGFDSWELSAEAKTALDNFVAALIETNVGVYLEIQGHTDGTGEAAWNLTLGEKRAQAVKDYLYKKHHIPLHRMEVVSFGSAAPVTDNATSKGRAANRRVEILVYE
jgi:outer membrane protein OmpA-like peptidoglycan-associated protein